MCTCNKCWFKTGFYTAKMRHVKSNLISAKLSVCFKISSHVPQILRPIPHPLEASPSKLNVLTNRFHHPFVATMYHFKLATTPSIIHIYFAHLQVIRHNIASHSADDRCWAADQWAPIRSQWNHDLEAACRCRCQFNAHHTNVVVMLPRQNFILQRNLFFIATPTSALRKYPTPSTQTSTTSSI